MKEILNTNEAAEYLGITRRKLYTLIGDGDLEAFKIGSSLRVRRKALQAFIRCCIDKFQLENGALNYSVTEYESE